MAPPRGSCRSPAPRSLPPVEPRSLPPVTPPPNARPRVRARRATHPRVLTAVIAAHPGVVFVASAVAVSMFRLVVVMAIRYTHLAAGTGARSPAPATARARSRVSWANVRAYSP